MALEQLTVQQQRVPLRLLLKSEGISPWFLSTLNIRVFVHVYIHHFDRIAQLGSEAHVNTCYKHFYYFVTEFGLIDTKELEPLVSMERRGVGSGCAGSPHYSGPEGLLPTVGVPIPPASGRRARSYFFFWF